MKISTMDYDSPTGIGVTDKRKFLDLNITHTVYPKYYTYGQRWMCSVWFDRRSIPSNHLNGYWGNPMIAPVIVNITVTSQWARWRLKPPASRLFTQSLIQAQIKDNIKVLRHLPLCGEFAGDWWNSPHKWPVTRECFHLMTSSWATKKDTVDCTMWIHNNQRYIKTMHAHLSAMRNIFH